MVTEQDLKSEDFLMEMKERYISFSVMNDGMPQIIKEKAIEMANQIAEYNKGKKVEGVYATVDIFHDLGMEQTRVELSCLVDFGEVVSNDTETFALEPGTEYHKQFRKFAFKMLDKIFFRR